MGGLSMSAEELKQLLKDLQGKKKYLDVFSKIDMKKAEGFVEFGKRLRELPKGEILGQAIDEWKTKALSVYEKITNEKRSEFSAYVAEFIRSCRAENMPTREFQNAWRVGPVELQLRPEHGTAQYAYNNQIILKWFPVASANDLLSKYSSVKKQLEDNKLPTDLLADVFFDAYEYLKWKRNQRGLSNDRTVPAREFYKEVRVALLRKRLELKQSPKDLQLWAFLYNLDLYSASITQIPQTKRLGLQSGSQHEVSKGLGIVVNGLDALQDYKTICYIIM